MAKLHSIPLLIVLAAGATFMFAPTVLHQDAIEDGPEYLAGEICTSDDNGDAPKLGIFERLTHLADADHGHLLPQVAWQTPFTTKFDAETAKISFDLSPLSGDAVTAGEQVRAKVSVRDSETGLPISGHSVAGWMLKQRNAQVAAEMPCKAKAQFFTQGRVTARPDVDLNAARLLVLNRDGSVVIANPQIDFTITQMEGVIPLPGVPADWVLSDDGLTVFVSLPVYGAVAVIDARSFKMSGLIEFAKGSLPTDLLPLPDGALAVYLSATQSVTIAHPDGTGQTDPVAVGAGPIAMVRGAEGTLLIAGNGNLSLIDGASGALVLSRASEKGEPSLAYSPENAMVYAATTTSAFIKVLDAKTLEPRATIATAPGIFTLAMTPSRQKLIALNRDTSTLTLIDVTTNSVTAENRTPEQPVEVTFSHEYAYVRGLAGDHFSVIELAELGRNRIPAVDVQSAASPTRPREALSRAHMIAPYGHGALIGNADEAVAYYYMEGMNTPMGTVKTYGPNVQGLMTIDRGFRETAPGVYETTAVLPFGGTYDIPIAIDADGYVTCFTATAKAAAPSTEVSAKTTLRIEPEPAPGMVAKHRGSLVIRIVDSATGKPAEGLADVRFLAFTQSGSWQSRKWAVDLGQGRYAGEWVFPKAGRYGLSLEVASRGTGFADQAPLYFKVGTNDVSRGKDTAP